MPKTIEPRQTRSQNESQTRHAPFVRPTEIAARFGASPTVVYRWLDEGLLPHYVIGRSRFIREADFEEFLASRRVSKK